MLPEYFEFQLRTKVVFRVGAVEESGNELAKQGAKRPMLIIDTVFKDSEFQKKIEASLADAGLELAGVMSDIPVDSDVNIVKKGNETARAAGADSLIAVGGGSVIDTTKGINILLSEGGDLLEDHQGAYMQTRPLKPFLAIPTTAGTGSEVTFAAVIKYHEEHTKLSFVSPFFAPSIAILDPEITVGMPPKLTASTGMDALTHAVEAMHSTGRESWADALSLLSIKMIDKWLPIAVKDGKDIEARGQMLLAASMAGAAFSNALVGIVHAMAHSAGGVCSVPHGVANAILLPHGMEFNLDVCEDVYAQVALALGVKLNGQTERQLAEAGIARIRELTKACGLPTRLSEVGVTEAHIEQLAATAMGDGAMVSNPRFPEGEEEVAEVYRKAL